MDKFRTRVEIPLPASKISYHTRCLFMGSCFSDTIGNIMAGHKFPVLLNPFGTLFNPSSIGNNISRLIAGNTFTAEELSYYNDLWFSFSHYTGFAHTDRDTCLSAVNRSLSGGSQWIKHCDFLLLTFGTARIYQLRETGDTVANCHKLPAASFTSRLLAPDEIITQYDTLMNGLKQVNPGIRIIFTLSPVRHWSDGAEINQLSKSILSYT